MERLFAAAVILASVLVAGTAFAAQQTVKLAVENMYCASCPFIVQQSLAGVPGVSDVKISFRRKTATVTFDDSQTSVEALTDATFDYGYPSELAGIASGNPSELAKNEENWWSKLKQLSIFN